MNKKTSGNKNEKAQEGNKQVNERIGQQPSFPAVKDHKVIKERLHNKRYKKHSTHADNGDSCNGF